MSIRSYQTFGLFRTTSNLGKATIEKSASTTEESAGRWISYHLQEKVASCVHEQSTVAATQPTAEALETAAASAATEVEVLLDDRPTSLTEMIGCVIRILLDPQHNMILT